MTVLPSLCRFLLAGPLGGLVAACAFAGDLSAWHLRPSAQVDSGGLFLSAVVEGAADLPKVRLASAPAAASPADAPVSSAGSTARASGVAIGS